MKEILASVALSLGLFVSSGQASLLVYEGFNGYTTGNINGQSATNTTGLQGTWTVTNVLPGGGLASSVIQTTGLSFGSNFATSSGGALLQTSRFSGTAATTTATLQLNTSTTGTLWGSYLANFTTLSTSNNGSAQQAIGNNATATTTTLGSAVTTDASAANRKLTVKYDATSTASGNTAFTTGTDYLFISRYTNVGTTLSSGTTGVATTWVFTLAGYDNWFTTGGALEANLSTYAFVSRSDAAVTSGTFNFDSTGFMTLRANAPNINNAQVVTVFDELRYGTALTDVIAVPEPSIYAMFGLGLASLWALGRKKKA